MARLTKWRLPVMRSEYSLLALITLALGLAPGASALADDASAAHGRYLVTLGGCLDCHTPGYFYGKPDMARAFSGSDVGFEVPGLGVFFGPNLTSDQETGLGNWSNGQIATALTTGVRPDGRTLAPIMPWRALGTLTASDIADIISYLRTLPAIRNRTPGPFQPGETAAGFVMRLVPPAQRATPNDIGSTLADRWCKSCHDTTATPLSESSAQAPSFRSVASRPDTTVEKLDRHLSTGHTNMPDFNLSPYERSILIFYILSLR
jgi:mono/diheme cytochrome c family protein